MLTYTSCLILVIILPVLIAEQEFNQKDISNENFAEPRFDDICIFGDSFSDIGRVFKLSGKKYPISPPYFRGRYCNGPNWVDRLKSCNVKSFAYGSATSDNKLVPGYAFFNRILVPGIRQQVAEYINRSNPKKINFSRTLFIIWGGGNDFIENQTITPPKIVASLMNSVEDLLAFGALYIVVFNQQPSQYAPFSASLGAPPGALAYLVSLFNSALNTSMNTIQQNNTKATLNIFDINRLITKVITANSSYFTNTTANCWYTATNATTVTQLCSDPNKFVFLDPLHYSAPVHELIADDMQPFFLTSYAVNSATCYILPP